MSLATSKDNKPWVCEVHYAFDDDLNLYYRSLTSRRHSEEIAANPNVAGNIVKQHLVGEQVLGIYFEGIAEKLAAGAEQEKACKLIQERLQAPDSIVEEAQRPDGHQFYKITVENFYIFGNLDNKGNNKYEVVWNGGKK
jgi:uncharacterized protein YhbP (UPF0306 family)